jgi:hypothetical protein
MGSYVAITTLTLTIWRCFQWRTTITRKKSIIIQIMDNSTSSRICTFNSLGSQEGIRMQVPRLDTFTMELRFQIASTRSISGRKPISKLAYLSTILLSFMWRQTPRTFLRSSAWCTRVLSFQVSLFIAHLFYRVRYGIHLERTWKTAQRK